MFPRGLWRLRAAGRPISRAGPRANDANWRPKKNPEKLLAVARKQGQAEQRKLAVAEAAVSFSTYPSSDLPTSRFVCAQFGTLLAWNSTSCSFLPLDKAAP